MRGVTAAPPTLEDAWSCPSARNAPASRSPAPRAPRCAPGASEPSGAPGGPGRGAGRRQPAARPPTSTRARSPSRRAAPASRGSASSSRTATVPRWPTLGAVAACAARGRGASPSSPPPGGGWPAPRRPSAPDGPPGAGLVAVGGFAFAPDGGAAPHWAGFAPGELTVPEVAIARRGDDVRLTVAVLASADDLADELVARVERRLAGAARRRRCRCWTRRRPAASTSPRRRRLSTTRRPSRAPWSASAPAPSRRSCSRARSRSTRRAPHDAAAVFGVLRGGFDSCYVYCAGIGDDGGAAFVGASPELLVRREGLRASTVALAGSTRRSADPAVDAHLGEQLLRSDKDREEHAIVARRIARALRPAQRVGGRAGRAGDHPRRQHPAPRDADPRAAARSRAARSTWPGSCIRRRPSAASRTMPRCP